MDWKELQATLPTSPGLTPRGKRLEQLRAVLGGTMYDAIGTPFYRERDVTGEYVPLTQRRPAVQTGFARTVVDDSVGLLFGEGRFPTVRCDDARTAKALARIVRGTMLAQTMIEAATLGAVGSVAIKFGLVDFEPVFRVLPTATLTPSFAPDGRLLSVRQRYQLRGSDLAAAGYAISEQAMGARFICESLLDDQWETWFVPRLVEFETYPLVVDDARSEWHGFGFVPMVWIRNLPGGDGIDGACTFESAIDLQIETDYLLSQAGRALRYGSDPTLVLKSGTPDEAPSRTGGAATSLNLPPEGDAKLLEINGNAAGVVLAHVRYLRGLALERMHGNRADGDRIAAAQSGRAIELMHQPLVFLADRLRVSYGERALLELLRMVCRASELAEGGLAMDDERFARLDPAGLALHWPPYFPLTFTDRLALAQAVVTAKAGGVVSDETAVLEYATAVGMDDPHAEYQRILAERQAAGAPA